MSYAPFAITPSKGGANITTGAASARVAIPNAANGSRPRYVRIACTANARIRLGDSAVNAVATDMLVQPGDAVVVVVLGDTHVAAIQEAAAGTVSVQPLDE